MSKIVAPVKKSWGAKAGPLRRQVARPRRAGMGEALLALGRLKTGEMNKGEAAYAENLKLRERAGEVLWWAFEPVKFRLADNTFYSPDFAVMVASREIEMHEFKGFWTDDARVKIKVAASQFPMFRFIALKAKAKRDGGGWSVEEF